MFNAKLGKYTNGIIKRKVPYDIKNNQLLFYNYNYTPKIVNSTKFKDEKKVKLRFFNHAFLKFQTKRISFCTDPWAIGPAFNNGWWLKKNTHKDWIKELNDSNFVYISHNHPDHLHPLTLSKLDKNKLILVPNFLSNSTYLFLKDEGFKNITKLDFENQYKFDNSNLVLTLFKSGDFREDSGIYFSVGEFTALLDVDAGNINFNKLPKVSLYCSSFAGGASGFPTMFDTYTEEQKKKIINLDRKFIISKKLKNLKQNSAKYFMPYAGFFKEKLEIDKYVKNLNKKNKINDYLNLCKKNHVELLNVEKNDLFIFESKELIYKKKIKKEYYKDKNTDQYLKEYSKKNDTLSKKFIENYFLNSGYTDNLTLQITLTDKTFQNKIDVFSVDFNKKVKFEKITEKLKVKKNKNNRFLHLKIRKEAFINCLKHAKPWEDLLIGFQVKVDRNPNIYNSKFWDYFSNQYVSRKRVKAITNCNSCERLTQDLYKELN